MFPMVTREEYEHPPREIEPPPGELAGCRKPMIAAISEVRRRYPARAFRIICRRSSGVSSPRSSSTRPAMEADEAFL
jgi:hypothetical protein